MNDFRVTLAQIAPVLGDLPSNLERHMELASAAERDGSDLLVFPELSLTGYLLQDQVPDLALSADHEALERLASASRGIDLLVGFVEEAAGHRFYNAAGYFSRGRLLHVQRKLYLPTYGLFEEGRDLAAGDRLRAFDAPPGRSGILICEDLWHQTCAWLLAHQGAELLFGLSNGPTRGAKPGREITSIGIWRDLLQVTAQFLTSYIVYVNRVGCEDGLTFGGGSMVVDPFGRVVEIMPALDEGCLTVQLEAELLRRARLAYPLLRDERLELVARELARIRRERYDLPDDEAEIDGATERDGVPGAASRESG